MIDVFIISESLQEKLVRVHPLTNLDTIMPSPYDTFPTLIFFMDHTLDEAILRYRQLFYSAIEITPDGCDINKFLDYIHQGASNFPPVIIDYGGAFETEHLHLIQLAFPEAIIYSIDNVYKKFDLLICNINKDETKWCIIPVYQDIVKEDRLKLIESVCDELKGKSSVWNGIEISECFFYLKVDSLSIYDPYSELCGMSKINFIDSIEKCEIRPCRVFMAYNTYGATPDVKLLEQKGVIDPDHTIIDMYNGGYCTRRERPITTTATDRWYNIHAQADQLKLLEMSKKPTVSSDKLPRRSQLNWLNNNMMTKLVYDSGEHNQNDSMASSFGIMPDFLQDADCLNLSARMVENRIENLDSSIVRQFIEQHMSGFWKDIDYEHNSMLKCPKNFVNECLHEILGSVTNLHIHIDSQKAFYYSFEFIQQLQHEDPNLHIEISLTEQIRDKLCIPAISLVFECNQHYVLVHSKLEDFLQYVSACTSVEEIQAKVESSVAFSYAISQGQPVQWHKDLSFVHMAVYQDISLRRVQDSLLKLKLQDLNIVSKQLEDMGNVDAPQYQTNQAIICFNLSYYSSGNYRQISLSEDLIQQWIFNAVTCKYTGPIITLYPNESKLLITEYPQPISRTNVGSVYHLLCDNVSVLIQWRN